MNELDLYWLDLIKIPLLNNPLGSWSGRHRIIEVGLIVNGVQYL